MFEVVVEKKIKDGLHDRTKPTQTKHYVIFTTCYCLG